MPIHRLPDRPDLDYLRKKAKRLRRQVEEGAAEALDLVAEFHPRPPEQFKLADAQVVIARMHGFASWPRLVGHVGVVERFSRSPHQVLPVDDPADELLRLICLTYGADELGRVREGESMLAAHSGLAEFNVFTMAATGSAMALAEALVAEPGLASREGGPFDWEPLLYLTYSRSGGSDDWLETARTLLDHGADPNAGFLWDGLTSPFTALTGVFGGGESDQPPHPAGLDLARLLLEAGADPNDPQLLYNRGLGGSWDDDTEHLELLFEYGLGRGDGGVWNSRLGPTMQTPAQLLWDELATAALRGGPRRTRLLLENGAEVDGVGGHLAYSGRTPYELALVNGHTDVANLLAAAGATARLDDAETLVSSLMRGDLEAAHTDEAELQRVQAERPDLVNVAAEHGNIAAVRLLASLGWDVNHLARTTPLHDAAWNDDVEMARALIELGADPAFTDREHHATPLGWAEYGGKSTVANFLRERQG